MAPIAIALARHQSALLLRTHRCASPIQPLRRSLTLKSSKSPVLVSAETSPHFNLSVEDWLLKNVPADQPALFIYRNSPCVVIGRNQNPWKEVNLRAMDRLEIQLVRRRSGGGTVFHDLGNTNFSIHTPRGSFDRARTGTVVERAVREYMGVSGARTNERNDLMVDGMKVSGSAYKIAGQRAYHHGTMLIRAELSALGDALHNERTSLFTKGVASVRSPVRNLAHFVPDVSHEGFVQAMARAFAEEFDGSGEIQYVDTPHLEHDERVLASISELQTWDWMFGQTPEFTHELARDFAWAPVKTNIHSKRGVILEASFEPADLLGRLSNSLQGVRYGTLEGLSTHDLSVHEQDVCDWLREAM